MKYKANLIAAMTLLVVSLSAQAALILDQDVEDDGDWDGGNLFLAEPWNGDGIFGTLGPLLSPGHQEGLVAAVFQNNDSIQSLSTTFSSLTLQEGTYTLEFALGNYSNSLFPAVQINFAGLSLGDASAASTTPTPASGDWSLWTINFDVDSGNANLGNMLGFGLSTNDATLSNLAFDGVGDLSSNGNGFLVSYTPRPSTSVPEPSVIALFAAGLFGIGFTRRRMRS